MRVAVMIVALCAAAALPAYGTTPVERQIDCAVGGERFSFTDTMSSSSFGARPDGKPYSNWHFPLPVCPGNGLVMYRDFTAEELTRLPTILRSPAFAAARALNRPYYTAAFIERSLLPRSLMATWLLLQASWYADDDQALKTRFQQEFVSAAQATALEPDNERFVLRLRLANALRELGRFDEARASFATISTASVDQAFTEYVGLLLRVTDRQEASAEPLDAIPPIMAASLCLEHEGQPGWDSLGLCRAPELSSEVERIRENRRRAGIR